MDDIDIKCTYAIPVGDQDGPRPIVHGIAWNPDPGECSKEITCMLACVSSMGVSIFCLKKIKRRWTWTSMEIGHRPCSEANLLAWHPNGRVLAATSSGPGGKLHLLSYGKNGFTAKTVLQCPGGESVTSLCWADVNRSLVLAMHPSSALCFLRVKDLDPEILENLGLVKYAAHFSTPSPVLLASDSYGTLFAYSHNKLLHFKPSWKYQVGFKLIAAYDAPMGLRSIVFDETNGGLFTSVAREWTYWKIVNSKLKQVAVTPDKEKTRREGRDYTAIAIAPSGQYAATGGRDKLWIYDIESDLDHKFEIKYLGCRNHDVNWGDVTCIAFHPQEDRTKLISLGGDTGYLYIWAVVDRGKMKNKYTELVRHTLYQDNNKFYSRPFTNSDRKDDKFFVSDPRCPTIILKREDILNVEGIAQSESDADPGSQSAIQSPAAAAAAAGSPGVAIESSAAGSPAATESAAAAAAAAGSPAAIESAAAAGITLADKFTSLKKEAQKSMGDINDIAGQAIETVMSLGAQADDLLKRKEVTAEEITDFLKKVSSARCF